ncbi:MAG: hypothetical protein QXP60_09215 [Nitrososphaerota archaeon]
MNNIKRYIIKILKYFLLFSFIFTPFHLYNISLFRLNGSFKIFLKLNKYDIRIVPPLYRNFKISVSDGPEKHRIEFIYLPSYAFCPELKINSIYFSSFVKKTKIYGIIFIFQPYIKLPDSEEYGNFNTKITCISENLKDENYEIELYMSKDIDGRYLSPKSYDVKKIKEHEKYVKSKIIEFVNDTEVVKEDSNSYLIYLKYLYMLPIGNLFWSFQLIPKPDQVAIPPDFVYIILSFIAIYAIACHVLSLIWLPIFLLIPKNFLIIFFWIWFLSILILSLYLWKKEVKFVLNKIK